MTELTKAALANIVVYIILINLCIVLVSSIVLNPESVVSILYTVYIVALYTIQIVSNAALQ